MAKKVKLADFPGHSRSFPVRVGFRTLWQCDCGIQLPKRALKRHQRQYRFEVVPTAPKQMHSHPKPKQQRRRKPRAVVWKLVELDYEEPVRRPRIRAKKRTNLIT